MANLNTLPDSVANELTSLTSKLKGATVGRLVWERVLSSAEREVLPLVVFCTAHCVDQMLQLRQVSRTRAVLDAAYGIDLLTRNDYDRLLRETEGVERKRTDIPVWNAERRDLVYRGRLVRRVRGRSVATHIHTILDAFQEEGWPDRIDDPLTDGPNAARLRETIRTLNKGLIGLRFVADGSGEGILWKNT